MMRTRIISDLDGVVVDLVAEACYWFWLRYGVAVPSSAITTFEITDSLYDFIKPKQTIEEFKSEVRTKLWLNPEIYRRARPHFHLWRALLEWGDMLEFATNRPLAYGIERATRDWLDQHGFGDFRWGLQLDERSAFVAHCGEHNNCTSKQQLLQARCNPVCHTVFIEDNAQEAHAAAAQKLPNLEVWLIQRPWVPLTNVGSADGVIFMTGREAAERIYQMMADWKKEHAGV